MKFDDTTGLVTIQSNFHSKDNIQYLMILNLLLISYMNFFHSIFSNMDHYIPSGSGWEWSEFLQEKAGMRKKQPQHERANLWWFHPQQQKVELQAQTLKAEVIIVKFLLRQWCRLGHWQKSSVPFCPLQLLPLHSNSSSQNCSLLTLALSRVWPTSFHKTIYWWPSF